MEEKTKYNLLGSGSVNAFITVQLLAVLCSKHLATEIVVLSDIIFNYIFYLILFFFILQAYFWQKVLAKYDLSYIYPLVTSCNIVGIVGIGFLYGEAITLPILLGSFLIILGLFIFIRAK